MKKVKIYSIIIIMGFGIGMGIGKVLGNLGIHVALIVILAGVCGGFFGQKMFSYLDKKIK